MCVNSYVWLNFQVFFSPPLHGNQRLKKVPVPLLSHSPCLSCRADLPENKWDDPKWNRRGRKILLPGSTEPPAASKIQNPGRAVGDVAQHVPTYYLGHFYTTNEDGRVDSRGAGEEVRKKKINK